MKKNTWILLLLAVSRSHSINFYVSPKGKDYAAGTLASPCSTITKALDLAKAKTASMIGDINIYIRGGTYELNSRILIGPQYSGKNGYYVNLRNYPGEKVILSGGTAIMSQSWTLYKNGIYKLGIPYSLVSPMSAFRNLYVDGAKAVRARSQNLARNDGSFPADVGLDHESDVTVPNPFSITVMTKTVYVDGVPKQVPVDDHQFVDYSIQPSSPIFNNAFFTSTNFPGVEFVYYMPHQHRMFRWIPPSINTANHKIPFSDYSKPEGFQTLAFSSAWYAYGTGSYPMGVKWVENSLSLLDNPGEWYFRSATLYYHPGSTDIKQSTFVIPREGMTHLISIIGTPENRVSNFRICGLDFEHTYFSLDQQWGYATSQLQAVLHNIGMPENLPAAVEVKYADKIQILRNDFTNLGGDGINLNASSQVELADNHIYKIAGSGIIVGEIDGNADTTQRQFDSAVNVDLRPVVCSNISIRFNRIEDVGNEFFSGVGIFTGAVEYSTIQNNTIQNVSYTAIYSGWGWFHFWRGISAHNDISFNDIRAPLLKLRDGGGIYVTGYSGLDSAEGTKVESNLVTNWEGIAAIYLDNGTQQATVKNNVAFNGKAGYWLNLQKVDEDEARSDYERAVNHNIESNYSLYARGPNGEDWSDNPYPWQYRDSDFIMKRNKWPRQNFLVPGLNGTSDGQPKNDANEYTSSMPLLYSQITGILVPRQTVITEFFQDTTEFNRTTMSKGLFQSFLAPPD